MLCKELASDRYKNEAMCSLIEIITVQGLSLAEPIVNYERNCECDCLWIFIRVQCAHTGQRVHKCSEKINRVQFSVLASLVQYLQNRITASIPVKKQLKWNSKEKQNVIPDFWNVL
jgi:hypothetical protein